MRLGVLSFFYTLDAPLPPGTPPLQIAFSAPKRRYKKAVSRNRLKRMMREAFRLQAPRLRTLLKHKDRNLVMLIIYQGRNIGPYSALEATMVQGIERLVQRIEA